MDTSRRIIATTTTLSLVLHCVVVAMILLMQGDRPEVSGVGQALDVHLISSRKVADDLEAESSVKEYVIKPSAEKSKKVLQNVLLAKASQRVILVSDIEQKNTVNRSSLITPAQLNVEKDIVEHVAQATNASAQRHSIVELLHSRISDKKQYPYIARRQRREGVATVAFVLHPDGKIENARLINSSRTKVLDRAALSAVKDIEPFFVAQDYLKRPEKFQIDVAFNLL